MKIKIENAYSDGHESTSIQDVAEFVGDPNGDNDDDLEAYLYQFTGDGHGANSDLGFYYEITILESENPELVGVSMDWSGS